MRTLVQQLSKYQFLGYGLDRWCTLLLLIVGAIVACVLLNIFIKYLLNRFFKRFGYDLVQLHQSIRNSSICFCLAFMFHSVYQLLWHSTRLTIFLGRVSSTLYVLAITFFLVTLIPGIVLAAGRHPKVEQNLEYSQTLTRYIALLIRIAVILFATFAILSAWGINVSGIVAGVGIGGLAISLAAKDTLANLIGGMTIMLDRPFAIGDYIKIDDIEGTVEDIGFRSTRVRTNETVLIVIPNARMVSESLSNVSRITKRRIRIYVSVHIDTPSQKITQLFEQIQQDWNQNGIDDIGRQLSIEEMTGIQKTLLIQYFVKDTSWNYFVEERRRMMLEIQSHINSLEIKAAYQTYHLPTK